MQIAESLERTRGRRPWEVIAFLLLMLAVFGLAFVPLRASQDEWWHLKTGQWIVQHGGLPENDIFTYTGEGMRWYNHEWLSQVAFYGANRAAELTGFQGISGLIFFKSLVVVVAFCLVAGLARQRGLSWVAACVVALVAADISRRTIFPRPPIFSYLFLASYLLALYRWKRGQLQFKWLWFMVPATVAWANLHGMVLLSFIATGAYAGGEVLENLARWWRERKEGAGFWKKTVTRDVVGLSLLTAALIIACMGQPSGYHLFFLGRNFTADPLLQNIILEMQPTPWIFMMTEAGIAWRPPGFWTFWIALAIILVLLVRNRFRLVIGADYLLLAFFTYQAVMHWRLLPLFAVAAAGPAASLIAHRAAGRRWEVPGFMALLVGLVAWFNFGVWENGTFFERNMQMVRGEVTNLSDYPAPLMDYIIEADLPDRMFSDSNYCGYAIWRLSPERHKLFTDARFDVFGSQFIREERVVFYAAEPGDRIGDETVREGWRSILLRYGVSFLVFRPIDRPYLHKALLASDEWQMVYYYVPPEAQPGNWPLEANHVWVRKSAEAADIAARSERIFKRQFPGQVLPSAVARLLGADDSTTTGNTNTEKPDWRLKL